MAEQKRSLKGDYDTFANGIVFTNNPVHGQFQFLVPMKVEGDGSVQSEALSDYEEMLPMLDPQAMFFFNSNGELATVDGTFAQSPSTADFNKMQAMLGTTSNGSSTEESDEQTYNYKVVDKFPPGIYNSTFPTFEFFGPEDVMPQPTGQSTDTTSDWDTPVDIYYGLPIVDPTATIETVPPPTPQQPLPTSPRGPSLGHQAHSPSTQPSTQLRKTCPQSSSLDLMQTMQKRKYSKYRMGSGDDDETPPSNSPDTAMAHSLPHVPLPQISFGYTTSRLDRAEAAIREMKAAKISSSTDDSFSGALRQFSMPQDGPKMTGVDDFRYLLFEDDGPTKKKTKKARPSSVSSAGPNKTRHISSTHTSHIAVPTTMPAPTVNQPAATTPPPAVPILGIVKSSTKTATPYAKRVISNGSTRNAGYAPEFDETFAPGENARLPHCKMSAIEILCFFPRHTQWPDIMIRLLGNGWTSCTIADAILFSRGRLDNECHMRRNAALCRQVGNAGKEKFDNPAWTSRDATAAEIHPTSNYHVSQATPPIRKRQANLQSLKLVDVARGVQQWPPLQDRGLVSKALYFAHINPLLCGDLTTDDIQQVAVARGFTEAAGASSQDWDQQCLARMVAATKTINDRMAAERKQEKIDAEARKAAAAQALALAAGSTYAQHDAASDAAEEEPSSDTSE